MSRTKKSITPFRSFESRAPDGNEKGYIRLTVSLTESTAYKQLTASSKLLYIAMLFEAKGHEEVIVTGKKCEEKCGICHETYMKALKQLLKYGFIEKCPRSCFAPSRYRFSDKWKKW